MWGLVAVLLAGCSTPKERARQRAQREAAECTKRGFEEGTDAFESCRIEVRAEMLKRKEERMRPADDFRPKPAPQATFKW